MLVFVQWILLFSTVLALWISGWDKVKDGQYKRACWIYVFAALLGFVQSVVLAINATLPFNLYSLVVSVSAAITVLVATKQILDAKATERKALAKLDEEENKRKALLEREESARIAALPPEQDADAIHAVYMPRAHLSSENPKRIGSTIFHPDTHWLSTLVIQNGLDVDLFDVKLMFRFDVMVLDGEKIKETSGSFGPMQSPLMIVVKGQAAQTGDETILDIVPDGLGNEFEVNSYLFETDRLSNSFPYEFWFLIHKTSLNVAFMTLGNDPTNMPSGSQIPKGIRVSGIYSVRRGSQNTTYETDYIYELLEGQNFPTRFKTVQ